MLGIRTLWVDVNISTSGLLNLTIVSDRFVGLSIPQRQEQVLSFLHQSQVSHLSPGFLSLYTPSEAESLNLSRLQVVDGASVYTWQDLAIASANPQNQSQAPVREPHVPRTVTFYSLALRQAIQSKDFKNLVDRFSPVESIDQASEEVIERTLELLWGSRRRSGSKAKYVSRWVHERLTDSSGTTFPRSLSILLKGAKEQELSYRGQSSIKSPTDRLLRGKSLEIGLKKASEERCNAIKEEYPDLMKFFDSLKGVSALLSREELQSVWQESAEDDRLPFDEFADFLSKIGLAEWRDKEQRYKFADIYVFGFEMICRGTV